MVKQIYETLHTEQSLLDISPELEKKVHEMLTATERKAPNFWEIDTTESLYVPVDDGEIRVYHFKPNNPISKRPLVFIPGWGGTEIGFMDFYEVIHDKIECYYIETREKRSSRLDRKRAKMDMSQKAKDIQNVINHLELSKRDFVLYGTCWGGAIILQGLIDGTIEAPTIITNDPMHTLWFPKWFLRFVSPILPIFVVELIRSIIKRVQLRGMKEEVQRSRAETFADNAEIWKWKRAADSVKDFELFGKVSTITKEVFVTNGTKDKIHNQTDYPQIAAELPNGRFIYLKTDESRRERLMGLVTLEFSKITKKDGIPTSLRDFEKKIHR
ncbi:MAG: alpha/beta hydrolase [Candidatus Heimdallarchaeota archaeon]|nr:alpha/beta hydrolase [Candidatus Heimdallarchaeota archaeon]